MATAAQLITLWSLNEEKTNFSLIRYILLSVYTLNLHKAFSVGRTKENGEPLVFFTGGVPGNVP